jgi:biopolymer transport protein ExbD
MGISASAGSSKANDEPMMDINTTPLIDVLLVLLIMFIITIPIQNHAVKLDLPQPNPNDVQPPVDPVKNKIVVLQNGATLWNGTPVDLVQLRQYLDVSLQMTPVPELHLQPEPTARYEVVNQVLVVTKQAGVTKMGFVGNEQYATAF